MSEGHDLPDYVWHFKLSSDAEEKLSPDALTEMVRQQARALLRCVILVCDGADLKVTGFRFMDEADGEHAIYPEPAETSDDGRDPETDVRRAPDH
jgi:hypothetical protein